MYCRPKGDFGMAKGDHTSGRCCITLSTDTHACVRQRGSGSGVCIGMRIYINGHLNWNGCVLGGARGTNVELAMSGSHGILDQHYCYTNGKGRAVTEQPY